MKNMILTLPLLFISSLTLASGEKGNGGKGVVCRDGSGGIRSVVSLDAYEASTRNIPIQLGGINLSVDSKTALAIGRLSSLGDTKRASDYAQTISYFSDASKTRYLPGTTLTNTEDSYELSFPDGCDVEQIIIQKDPELPQDRFFSVSLDLWNRLDNDNKAILMLHEAIYREARSAGATDSYLSRYFNSYIFGDLLSQYSVITDYANLLVKFHLPTVTFGGVLLSLTDHIDGNDPIVLSRGALVGATAAGIAHINGADFLFLDTGKIFSGYGNIEFYPSGVVKDFSAWNGAEVDPDPALSDAYGDPFVKLKVGNSTLIFYGNEYLEFYENGGVASGHLSQAQVFLNTQGQSVDCQTNDTASFTTTGVLVSCQH